MRTWLVLVTWLASFTGCSATSPTGPTIEIPPANVRVLFVGNSLTYTHDVPGLVQALADRAGHSMSHGTIAYPNYALEDHWNDGIAAEITRLRPDVVIMQQGPSSLPDSRDHLITWSRTLADAVRTAGGEPALYMVWPDASRRFAFDAVHDSYAMAAAEAQALFMPAGSAWVEAWKRDATLPLYGPDGFHPSYLGALVAAHSIYAVLLDVDPMETPALDDQVTAGTLQDIRSAVRAAVLAGSSAAVDSG